MWVSLLVLLLMASPVWAAPASVKLTEGEQITSKEDIAATTSANVLIGPANTLRGALNCYTTTEIRWGDSAISATRGSLIPASTPFVIRNIAAVYARATSSAGTISCTEEIYVSGGGNVFSP